MYTQSDYNNLNLEYERYLNEKRKREEKKAMATSTQVENVVESVTQIREVKKFLLNLQARLKNSVKVMENEGIDDVFFLGEAERDVTNYINTKLKEVTI